MMIFIAESNEDLRVGLQMYLQNEVGLNVVGIAVQAKGLIRQLEATEADVLILDWSLQGSSMPELLTDIRRLQNPPKIVVLAARSDIEAVALDAGADAFFDKGYAPGRLLEAVQSMKELETSS